MRAMLAACLSALTALLLAAGASAASPSVTTVAASGVGAASAQLNGTVNPNGLATTWHFEYGTSTGYGSTTTSQSAGSGTSPTGVFQILGGLQTGKTYHYRLVATNENGTSTGADASFTTGAGAPVVTTDAATGVTANSATLHGTVNANGEPTTYYFEYGTSNAYGTKTAAKNAGNGTKPANFSQGIAGLAGGTTYHYRLVATNSTGTATGADQTFVTSGPPVLVTGAAQGVSTTGATLTGSVNPVGHGTTWHFDYGTTTSYGSRTANQNAGAGTTAASVSAAISGLAPSMTYHYRIVASSSGGTTNGADQTFTTLAAVSITKASFRVIAGHFGSIAGTVTGAQAGVSVTIMAEPFGQTAFAPVATVLTGANGTWTYNARPTIRTVYQASANGGTSGEATIGVQPAVTLRLTSGARYATHVSAGATSFAGKIVQFQRRSGDRWVTVKRTRVNGNSSALFSGSLLPKGKSTIRVAMSVNQAGPGYLGGFSRQLRFRRG
jgi:hypothetical protein